MIRKRTTTHKRWALQNRKTKKCGTCRTKINGPARKVGSSYRCYWCNKRIGSM